MNRELQRVLTTEFPELPADALGRTEEHNSMARTWGTVRRDVAVALGNSQYRIRAIEKGLLAEFRLDLARRYFRFLGIVDWIERWCEANHELAIRVGLLDGRSHGVG